MGTCCSQLQHPTTQNQRNTTVGSKIESGLAAVIDLKQAYNITFDINSNHTLVQTFLKIWKSDISIKEILEKLAPSSEAPKECETFGDAELCRVLPLLVTWMNMDFKENFVEEDDKIPILWLIHATSDYWGVKPSDVEIEIKRHLGISKINDVFAKALDNNKNSLYSEKIIYNTVDIAGANNRKIDYKIELNVDADYVKQQQTKTTESEDFRGGTKIKWVEVSLAGMLLNLLSNIGLYFGVNHLSVVGVQISESGMNCINQYFDIKYAQKRDFEMTIKKFFGKAQYFNTEKMQDGLFHHSNCRDHGTSYMGDVDAVKQVFEALRKQKLQCSSTDGDEINQYFKQIMIDTNKLTVNDRMDESKDDEKDEQNGPNLNKYLNSLKITFSKEASDEIDLYQRLSKSMCKKNLQNLFQYFYVCCCNDRDLNTMYARTIAGHDRPLSMGDFTKTRKILLTDSPYKDGIIIDKMVNNNLSTTSRMFYICVLNEFKLKEAKMRISLEYLKNNRAFRLDLVKNKEWECFTELFFGIVHEHGHLVPPYMLPSPRISCSLFVVVLSKRKFYVQGGCAVPIITSGGQYVSEKGNYHKLRHEIFQVSTFEKRLKYLYISDKDCEKKGLALINDYQVPKFWDSEWGFKDAPADIDTDGDTEPSQSSFSTEQRATVCGYGFEDETHVG